MFEGLRSFMNMFDVSPIWPAIIIVGLIVLCTVPYKPVYKIKKTKDEKNNTVYTVWKYR